jgi:hypothetical protein
MKRIIPNNNYSAYEFARKRTEAWWQKVLNLNSESHSVILHKINWH